MGQVIRISPCVECIDCSLTDRMEDPDVVHDHTLPEPKFAIMEDVNRHYRSRINTELGVVCILEQGELGYAQA